LYNVIQNLIYSTLKFANIYFIGHFVSHIQQVAF
jgi:hypothetical protein